RVTVSQVNGALLGGHIDDRLESESGQFSLDLVLTTKTAKLSFHIGEQRVSVHGVGLERSGLALLLLAKFGLLNLEHGFVFQVVASQVHLTIPLRWVDKKLRVVLVGGGTGLDLEVRLFV